MTQHENNQGDNLSITDQQCQTDASPAIMVGVGPLFHAPSIDCVAYICPGAACSSSSANYKMCASLAEQAGFKITETYQDDNIWRRPQLSRLMSDAKLGQFTQVIISDIHRLGAPKLRIFDLANSLLSLGITLHCGHRGSLISLHATDRADATSKAWQIDYLVTVMCAPSRKKPFKPKILDNSEANNDQHQ
jgi:Resolvase, N terminal domain